MKFLKEIYFHYIRSNTFEKGAALSYYTVFSFIPIMMFTSFALESIFRDEIVSGEMNAFLENIVGQTGAEQIESILGNQKLFQSSLISTITGIVTLLLAASGMFSQVHKSMNDIWRLKVKAEKSLFNYFARHLSSLLVIILIVIFILLSTAINTVLLGFSARLPENLKYVQLYEHLISFFLFTFLFTLLFKIAGNAIVPWITAIVSAGITATLFIIGKIGIGTYVAYSNINTTFGTASLLALLMIWVYYSSQILFIGASFAYVFGKRSGHEIRPTSQVVRFIRQELE